MPKRDRKHMTLKERAILHGRWTVAVTPKIAAYKGYLAGWHARGRADRVMKAVVRAAKKLSARGFREDFDALNIAVSNLERAKGRKR